MPKRDKLMHLLISPSGQTFTVFMVVFNWVKEFTTDLRVNGVFPTLQDGHELRREVARGLRGEEKGGQYKKYKNTKKKK